MARETSDSPERAVPADDNRAGYWMLLKTVPKLVAKAGFSGLSYRRLAREAGVTHGLVSYYFGSRQQLIQEAANVAVEDAMENSRLAPASGSIDDFASGLAQLVAKEREAQVFQYELACEALRNPELLALVRDLYERYTATTAEAMAAFGVEDDEPAARLVFAALDGLALRQLIFGEESGTTESVATLRRMLELYAADRDSSKQD